MYTVITWSLNFNFICLITSTALVLAYTPCIRCTEFQHTVRSDLTWIKISLFQGRFPPPPRQGRSHYIARVCKAEGPMSPMPQIIVFTLIDHHPTFVWLQVHSREMKYYTRLNSIIWSRLFIKIFIKVAMYLMGTTESIQRLCRGAKNPRYLTAYRKFKILIIVTTLLRSLNLH